LGEHGDTGGAGGEVDPHRAGLRVDGADLPADLELDLAGVGDDDRAGEAHTVVDDGTRVAGPLGDGRRGQPHRRHAVRDDPVETDLAGHALVPVDRVEVAGGPGVAHEQCAVEGEGAGEQLVPDGEPAHRPSPRTARVERTVATGAPPSSAISARVLTIAMPARSVIESTWTVVRRRSPATVGRWCVKRSSAWTTREKSIPDSGSAT